MDGWQHTHNTERGTTSHEPAATLSHQAGEQGRKRRDGKPRHEVSFGTPAKGDFTSGGNQRRMHHGGNPVTGRPETGQPPWHTTAEDGQKQRRQHGPTHGKSGTELNK